MCYQTIFVDKSLKKYSNLWRRERDSNPRKYCYFTRFPSVLIKPLSHLSVAC
ncbi:uncharacterized protein METZ01_LOCUS267597, partial [marine metagenome]